MNRILKQMLGAAGLLLFSSLMVPAQAAHPTQICLDVSPDREWAVSNDRDAEQLEAAVGATDADHEEPHEEGCVIGEGGGQTEVDFEITGVSDPDESDTPETPDMSCATRDGTAFCTVIPPSAAGGEQTIAAWIDFDRDNSTVELDRDEEVDDDDTDSTDVALWTWTHGDPCGEFTGCSQDSLTIRYNYQDVQFEGRITAEDGCMTGRWIRVHRKRQGRDLLVTRKKAAPSGQWQVAAVRRSGRYYAVARRTHDGCSWQRSSSIRVR